VTFRADLLSDCRIALAGAGGGEIPTRLRALGAFVALLGEPVLLREDDAAAWARERAPLRALVLDAGGGFGSGGAERLGATLELAWRAARAVATGALIDAGRPGRLLFIAPRPDAGPHAPAARAALENLARTLSVEWARFMITAVALTPGPATTDAELAELVCFLVSAAGGYFSGCRFDLGSTPVTTSTST
jgi:NAD(P)-dependent dehydrogenase (short-subunit alcohol dehydrogenase family)